MAFQHGVNHRVDMVFQEPDLFPWMSLQRNIEFLLENNPRIPKTEVTARARLALQQVDLGEFCDYLPHQVSGGMKQRVSIARSFACEADLLLMDEPFVYLDYQSRLHLHQLLLDMWSEKQATIVFVTHDIEEAVFLADRVLVMSKRPGRIIRDTELPFSRPRQLSELRRNPEYIETVEELTQLILSS